LADQADQADLPVRPDLRGQRPYGAPQVAAAVRLNTNENPFAPSAALVADVARAVAMATSDINRYPDRDAIALRAGLAAYLNATTGSDLATAQMWAANGSNEVLQQLLQAFGGPDRRALGFEPSYSMHHLISRGTGTEYIAVDRAPDYGLPVEIVTAAIGEHRPDVVFLCTPNNPTGAALEPSVIAAAYDATAGLVIVDEAYAEFSSQPSALTLLPGRPRLVVVRTMSKAFAFAGARVGYLAADRGVVDAVQLVRLPYHISALTQAAALVALSHRDELLGAVAEVCRQRDRIVARLTALGCSVAGSDANFVLFGGPWDAPAIWQSLLDRGILIRDVGLPGRLRVTAGTQVETDTFLAAVADVLAATA
jgi:histidinol-phosphate aminotransferase